MSDITVSSADPRAADIRHLLERHWALMRASSPEESCHVLPPDSFDDGVHLFAAHAEGQALGIGAMQLIAPKHGELKSMHTLDTARGRGVGRAILHRILAEAQTLRWTRMSLETGSAALFAPARALYEAHGFEQCPPFGAYVEDPHSIFMTKALP